MEPFEFQIAQGTRKKIQDLLNQESTISQFLSLVMQLSLQIADHLFSSFSIQPFSNRFFFIIELLSISILTDCAQPVHIVGPGSSKSISTVSRLSVLVVSLGRCGSSKALSAILNGECSETSFFSQLSTFLYGDVLLECPKVIWKRSVCCVLEAAYVLVF